MFLGFLYKFVRQCRFISKKWPFFWHFSPENPKKSIGFFIDLVTHEKLTKFLPQVCKIFIDRFGLSLIRFLMMKTK